MEKLNLIVIINKNWLVLIFDLISYFELFIYLWLFPSELCILCYAFTNKDEIDETFRIAWKLFVNSENQSKICSALSYSEER